MASKPVCNDTNCWFAVAREYGRRYSRNYNWGLIDIFESYFIPSERYGTLDYDTRDALISNIVETAGFTPKDMERIGLTNFLNQVSQ